MCQTFSFSSLSNVRIYYFSLSFVTCWVSGATVQPMNILGDLTYVWVHVAKMKMIFYCSPDVLTCCKKIVIPVFKCPLRFSSRHPWGTVQVGLCTLNPPSSAHPLHFSSVSVKVKCESLTIGVNFVHLDVACNISATLTLLFPEAVSLL